MKALGIILSIVLLAGCADKPEPVIRTPQSVVFIPDESFFRCPTVSRFPDPTTLTDGQIADLLIRLDTNNRTCAASIRAIRAQLIAAQSRIETDNDPNNQ